MNAKAPSFVPGTNSNPPKKRQRTIQLIKRIDKKKKKKN